MTCVNQMYGKSNSMYRCMWNDVLIWKLLWNKYSFIHFFQPPHLRTGLGWTQHPFHLVSWRKPQSSLLLVAVSTISALRPLIVPTFILPVRNTSSFGVWILFFLRRSHNSPRWQDRPRSRLPAQPRPGPAATRLLVPALAEISVWPVMREEWGDIFYVWATSWP